MVTTSELNQLNEINEKEEQNLSFSGGSFIPNSIRWILQHELEQASSSSTSIENDTLRNKRLHYLFKQQTYEDEPVIEELTTNMNTTDEEDDTSVNFPTTLLKTHELTNNLEFELMQSSLQLNNYSDILDMNIVDSIHDDNEIINISDHTLSEEVVENDQLNPSSSLIHLEEDTPLIQIHRNHHRHHQSHEQHHTVDSIKKPIKRFKSKSSYDLNFPNLNCCK
ncbi:uncharacterized protein J8A68_005434 [[Candida] subhashii]|uniref:Uncharacterized protein n=1 Tax=[Candida] subhashii TaxID=561895 RepID=A0A8J5QCS1_9ASCO|nr:uncharacterized protein J8A68_005434 [[Candida] subhashii]KAG7661062.1 hypothetical protein J8A68_005434 [[Candida] subhashii]